MSKHCGYCDAYLSNLFSRVYDDGGREYCTTSHRDAQHKLEHKRRVLAYQEQQDARHQATQ